MPEPVPLPSAARRAVLAKLRRVVKKHGINGEFPEFAIDDDSTDAEFVAALGAASEAYHSHTRVFRDTPAEVRRNVGATAERTRRRPPEFRWLLRPRVGTIKFFTFIQPEGDDDDPRPRNTVAATRTVLEGWVGRSATRSTVGLVVDLRHHSGGNYRPALHALGGHLLHEKHRLSWVDRAGGEWSTFYDGDREVHRKGPARLPEGYDNAVSGGARVAVLIGPKTGSSGEILAAMFAGKVGARLFGAPSAGALSVNGTYDLGFGVGVHLTTERVRTSDGVLHADERLVPDVLTKRPMTEAVAWLKSENNL